MLPFSCYIMPLVLQYTEDMSGLYGTMNSLTYLMNTPFVTAT